MVPLLQVFCARALVVSYMAFVLSLFDPRFFFFCLRKAVLRDYDIPWVSLFKSWHSWQIVSSVYLSRSWNSMHIVSSVSLFISWNSMQIVSSVSLFISWNSMQIVSSVFVFHSYHGTECKLFPQTTVCMVCQIILIGKTKEIFQKCPFLIFYRINPEYSTI